jgi:hypothetical protein
MIPTDKLRGIYCLAKYLTFPWEEVTMFISCFFRDKKVPSLIIQTDSVLWETSNLFTSLFKENNSRCALKSFQFKEVNSYWNPDSVNFETVILADLGALMQ